MLVGEAAALMHHDEVFVDGKISRVSSDKVNDLETNRLLILVHLPRWSLPAKQHII